MRPAGSLTLSLLLLSACCGLAHSTANAATCQSVSAAYAAKNLDVLHVQYQASGAHLAVCPARPGPTCCSRAMEAALENRAKTDMYQFLYQQLVPRSTSLASLLSSFQSLIQQILNASYDGLDKNLKSIYGYSYIENKQPFVTFYDGLRAYMAGGPDTVAELARNLFDSISARVYVLVMANYNIDDAYLTCLRGRLNQLMPLGSMPERIGQEFVRAFVPARRFLAGLAAMQDAVELAPAIRLTERCQRAQLRSQYCAWCDGLTGLRPCQGLCFAALADCIAPLDSLAEPFDLLVDELVHLSEKIRGPNNVYQVLNQLGLRISGGIMDMQERKDSIQAQVSKLCGPPKLKAGSPSIVQPPPAPSMTGRRRRRRRSSDMFGWTYRSSDDPPTVSDKMERLGKLTRSARQGLLATRGLFRSSQLAQQACQVDPPPPDGRCWNGTDPAGSYTPSASPAGSPIEPPSPAVAQRAANLRAAHRLAAELPRSENFAGFAEQRLDAGLAALLSRRAGSGHAGSGGAGGSITDALPPGVAGSGGGSSLGTLGGAGGGSGSGAAPPPLSQPQPRPPAPVDSTLRLSTLPPRTPPPPPPPVAVDAGRVWPSAPQPPVGSGDSSPPLAGPPPTPDVLAVTRQPPPRQPITEPPKLPEAAASTTTPAPHQPPPVDAGRGSGDGEQPPPPPEVPPPLPSSGPVLPVEPVSTPSSLGGVASGDAEPTEPPVGPPQPPQPPRPQPSVRPPPIVDGDGSGDGEQPPPPQGPSVQPSQPPPPPQPPISNWTPFPPLPPQPPQQPATREPPAIPRPPAGSDLWLPKEPDDQGGAERGGGEGSIHGPMKMTSSKRSGRTAAVSAVAIPLLACLQRLALQLR